MIIDILIQVICAYGPFKLRPQFRGSSCPHLCVFPAPSGRCQVPFFTLGKPLWRALREREPWPPPGGRMIIHQDRSVPLVSGKQERPGLLPLVCSQVQVAHLCGQRAPSKGTARLCPRPEVGTHHAPRPWARPVCGRSPCAELCWPPGLPAARLHVPPALPSRTMWHSLGFSLLTLLLFPSVSWLPGVGPGC